MYSVKELKTIAKGLGLKGYSKMNKHDLEQMIFIKNIDNFMNEYSGKPVTADFSICETISDIDTDDI